MSSDSQSKPFIGMLFKCCNVYMRIYRNREGTAYEGRCPRCGKPITIRVGEGGSDARFWSAR